MQSACAVVPSVACLVVVYHIFPHLINGVIFWEGGFTEHKMCVVEE